jgi:hypothetical protein
MDDTSAYKMLLLLPILVQIQVHIMNNNLKLKRKNCYVHHSCIQAKKEKGFSMRISTNHPFYKHLNATMMSLCHFNFIFYPKKLICLCIYLFGNPLKICFLFLGKGLKGIYNTLWNIYLPLYIVSCLSKCIYIQPI